MPLAAIEDEQTPDQFIRGLRSVTDTDHPFVDEEWGEDYGPIFARFAHALADFLHDARAVLPNGYVAGRIAAGVYVSQAPRGMAPEQVDAAIERFRTELDEVLDDE